MKQSLGLKAAVKAIQERYKIKEGLARRLARAEAEVLKKVYPSISSLSTDEVLEVRYAAPSGANNILKEIHIPMILAAIPGTKEAQSYQMVVREVILATDEEDEEIIEEFQGAIMRPDADEVARLKARMAELISKVQEFREAFQKYEDGLITKEELYRIKDEDEMIQYRLMFGDYGEEAEAEEFARGEPTYERWLKERGGAR